MSSNNVTPIRGGSEPPTSGLPPATAPKKQRARRLNRTELGQRLDAERSRLFRALGIVSVVRDVLRNSESEPDNVMRNAVTDSWCALDAAHDVIDEVAGAIESGAFLDPED